MTSPVEKVREMIGEEVAKEVAKAVAEKNGNTEDITKLVEELLETRLQELHSRTRSRSTQNEGGDYPIDWSKLQTGDKRVAIDIYGFNGPKQLIQKGVLTQTSISSSSVIALPVWVKPENRPWLREFGRVFGGGPGGSSVKYNELHGVTSTNRTSEKTQRSYGGDITTVSKVHKNLETTVQIANNVIADLGMDGIYNELSTLMTGVIDSTFNVDAVAAVKTSVASSTAGTAGQITSGKANTGLTKENVVSKLSSLMTKVKTKYWSSSRCKFLLAEDVYETLLTSTSGEKGEFSLRPLENALTLFGHEIIATDELDSTNSDGDLKAIFGNIYESLGISVREEFTISEFTETEPRTTIWIGHSRAHVHLYNEEPVAGIVIGA